MNFEITGSLILKEDEVAISDRFKKREFVIEVVNERNSEWNDFVKFQLTQDRCNLIDSFNEGDQLKVSFNIRGRKWEKDGRVNYFSNLEAWRVEKANVTPGANEPNSEYSQADIPPAGEDEDLPF